MQPSHDDSIGWAASQLSVSASCYLFGQKSSMAAATDRVEAILSAADNPVEILRLPAPTLDALDRAVWAVEDADIARQWRKLSRCCHPDKDDSAAAAQAFERLTTARDQLLDHDNRAEILRKASGARLLRGILSVCHGDDYICAQICCVLAKRDHGVVIGERVIYIRWVRRGSA